MKVICISGKAQHGKDTTAGMIKEKLESGGHTVLIAHYGDLVKYICKTFFDWDGNKDAYGRSLMQYVGTDVIRAQAPDYWVQFIADMLTFFKDDWDYVLIPDARFPNEIDVMREKFGALHIRVVRPNFESPLTPTQQQHISETALDEYFPDWLFENSGDIALLAETVDTFLRYEKQGVR